jgi:hypothetical protein
MQTLTRLMARLWEALFSKTSPKAKRSSGGKRPSRAKFPGPRQSLSSMPSSPPPSGRSPATFEDPDDIAFCTWMYYLN